EHEGGAHHHFAKGSRKALSSAGGGRFGSMGRGSAGRVSRGRVSTVRVSTVRGSTGCAPTGCGLVLFGDRLSRGGSLRLGLARTGSRTSAGLGSTGSLGAATGAGCSGAATGAGCSGAATGAGSLGAATGAGSAGA